MPESALATSDTDLFGHYYSAHLNSVSLPTNNIAVDIELYSPEELWQLHTGDLVNE